MPPGDFVYTHWPCTILAYPERGALNDWGYMYQKAEEVGCVVSLGGKRTKNRTKREMAALTVRGRKLLITSGGC